MTTQADNGPKSFELSRPIEYRGDRLTNMTAREPKIRDLRTFIKEVDMDPILAMEKLIANLCGVDTPIAGELSPKDFGRIRKWIEGFLLDMANESAE